jgi:hypothetical protein
VLWRNNRYFELPSEYKKLFPSGTLLRKADQIKLIAFGILLGGIIFSLFLTAYYRANRPLSAEPKFTGS